MAGDINTKISLQMQADTRQAQQDLSKVADAFSELSKQVTQINVNLVGLTPATQQFLQDLQGVAASAGTSHSSLSKLATVDLQSTFSKATQSSGDFDKQLIVLAQNAMGAGQSLSTIKTQSLETSKGFAQFTSGISGVTTEVDTLRQGFGELIAMQREQTKAMQELAASMEGYRKSGAQTNTETKGWMSTLAGYGKDVIVLVAAVKSLGDVWAWLTGKQTAEQKALADHTIALKDNTLALRGEAASSNELALATEPLEDSLKRTGFQASMARVGFLALSETTIVGAGAFGSLAASLTGVGTAFTIASLAVTAYKLGWDGTIQAIQEKVDTFDQFAFKLGDAVESGLSAASKSFRETVQGIGQSIDNAAGKIDEFKANAKSSQSAVEGMYDTFSGLPSLFKQVADSIAAAFSGMADKIKSEFEKAVSYFDDTAKNWPTLMRPITDAEREFLQEHIKTWSTIDTMADDYKAKFGEEMPQAVRNAALSMRQAAQPAMFGMVEDAAAAGKSYEELSANLGTLGAKLTGGFSSQFRQMSQDIHGSLADAVSSIKPIVPLSEQVAKAGNVDTATKIQMWKDWRAETVAQSAQIKEAAQALGMYSQKQIDDTAAALKSAEATRDKAKADLEAAQQSKASQQVIQDLKGKYDSANASVKGLGDQYKTLQKKADDANAQLLKQVQDQLQGTKKQEDALTQFAGKMAGAFGVSTSSVLQAFAAVASKQDKAGVDMDKLVQKSASAENSISSFTSNVLSGTYTSMSQMMAAAIDMTGQADKSQQAMLSTASERLTAAATAIKDQQKAVQDSVKTMQDTVGQGFAAMKQQAQESFEAANKDIQQNKQEWHTALSENQNDVRLAQHEFDAYAGSIKTNSQAMATQVTDRFSEIRAAIQKAMAAGDTKTVEALKKGLADYAQSSAAEFQKLSQEVKGTYDALKTAHQKLIDDMKQKESEWAKARQANEQLIYDAVNNVTGRTMNAKQLYDRTISEIEANRAEADRLMAQGDADSIERAQEYYKKNIQLSQSLKSVRMTTYDELGPQEKEWYDQQINNLQSITSRTAEQEAQLQQLTKWKKDSLTYVTEEKAQQDALNNISIDANKLQDAEIQKLEAAKAANQEQLAVQAQQLETMRQLKDSLDATVKTAKEQVSFALDTSQAEAKIQALLQAKTMQVDFDMSASKALLDQILAPRTMQVNLDFSGNLPDGASIPGKSTGGFMPGYGGGDRNLILTEDGEYVIKKEAVRFYGIDFIDSVNSMRASLAQAGSSAWASQSAYNTYNSLMSSTKGIKGFQGGGLVSGNSAEDLMRAIGGLNEAINSLVAYNEKTNYDIQSKLETVQANLSNNQAAIVRQTADQIRGLGDAIQSATINVSVKDDGVGKATGSWGRN